MEASPDNWFQLLQSIFIVAGFAITALSFRSDIRSRKVSVLLRLIENYRDTWHGFMAKPELSRVLEDEVDLKKAPIKDDERCLATAQLIIHLSSVFVAQKMRQIPPIEGMERDVRSFFSKPIPEAIWKEIRDFQNADFVAYVEKVVSSGKQGGDPGQPD